MYRRVFPRYILSLILCIYLATFVGRAQVRSDSQVLLTKCWTLVTSPTGRLLALNANTAFIGSDGAKIEAVSADGKKVWSSEFGGVIISNLLAADNDLYFVTSTASDGAEKIGTSVLRSISSDTGITNWTVKLPDAVWYALYRDTGSIISVAQSGTIGAIATNDGAIKWSSRISQELVSTPAFFENTVYIATAEQEVMAVSLENGKVERTRKLPYGITALGIVKGGDLVVGDERGNLISFDGTVEKVLWKYKSGGEVSGLAFTGNHLVATSYDNFVYCLSTGRGDVEWKKRFTGRIGFAAILSDDLAAITTLNESGGVMVDLANGKAAAQFVMLDGEFVTAKPLGVGGYFYVLTNRGISAYSIDGCAK